jgi:hypothetical protein
MGATTTKNPAKKSYLTGDPIFNFVQVSYLLRDLHPGADRLIFHHSRTMSINRVSIIGFGIPGHKNKQIGW